MKCCYLISSLKSDGKLLLQAVGTYWEIENKVHWALDIAFREDDGRMRKGNGTENSVPGQVALNLPKRRDTTKCSLQAKRKKAGCNSDYLLKVLNRRMRSPQCQTFGLTS